MEVLLLNHRMILNRCLNYHKMYFTVVGKPNLVHFRFLGSPYKFGDFIDYTLSFIDRGGLWLDRLAERPCYTVMHATVVEVSQQSRAPQLVHYATPADGHHPAWWLSEGNADGWG